MGCEVLRWQEGWQKRHSKLQVGRNVYIEVVGGVTE